MASIFIIILLIPQCHTPILALTYTGISTVGTACDQDSHYKVKFIGSSGESLQDQGFVVACLWRGNQFSWMLICDGDHTMSTAAGDAACRQNGYTGLIKDWQIDKPGQDVLDKYTLAFNRVSCPVVKDYTENGALVLARCFFQNVINERSCRKFLSVECSGSGSESSPKTGYPGQVFLKSKKKGDTLKYLLLHAKNSNTGHGEWGYVCINKDMPKDQLANSVCRQLGFTNMRTNEIVRETDITGLHWQVDGVIVSSCVNNSLPCFIHCLSQLSLSNRNSCDKNYGYFQIHCEFDGNPSFMVRMSSGSRALCQSGTYEATEQGDSTYSLSIVEIAVSIVLCLLTVIIIIITTSLVAYKVPKKVDQKIIRRDQENMEANERNMQEVIQRNMEENQQNMQEVIQRNMEENQRNIQGTVQRNMEENQRNIQGAVQRNMEENQQNMQEAVQRNIKENQRNMRENIEAVEQNFQREIRNVQQNLQLLQDIPQNVVELQQNVINLRASLQELQQNMQQGFQHNVEQIRQIVLNDGAN